MNWSLLQNGIGIDIQGADFRAVCVKRQWKRLRVASRLEIPEYRKAGPQQCGELYREFLHKNGLNVPWTVVALPRSAVLLRWLRFPQAVEKDLATAVRFQLDSLHPFEEDRVYWDFGSWKLPSGGLQHLSPRADRLEVPVAVAEKEYIDEIASWFRQAGIGVSQFTVATAALMAALAPRLVTQDKQAFFLLNIGRETAEITGYAPGSFASREAGVADATGQDLLSILQRELELIRSELRLDPEIPYPLVVCGRELPLPEGESEELRFSVVPPDQLFPSLGVTAPDFRMQEDLPVFAAGLAAVGGNPAFALNLLPPERRSYRSPLVYVPAYVLSGLIVLLALALAARGTFQDWRYERYMERQIQTLQPEIQRAEAAQQQGERAGQRLAFLGSIRRRASLPLEILTELTRLLPPDTWLQQMQYDGDKLYLSGSAKSASPLLKDLANSSYFANPQFMSSISKGPNGKEIFRISVLVRK